MQATLFCCLVLSHECVSFHLKLFHVNFITLSLSCLMKHSTSTFSFSSFPSFFILNLHYSLLYPKNSLQFVYVLHSFLFLHWFQLPFRHPSILSIYLYLFDDIVSSIFPISLRFDFYSIPIPYSDFNVPPSLRKEKYGNKKIYQNCQCIHSIHPYWVLCVLLRTNNF